MANFCLVISSKPLAVDPQLVIKDLSTVFKTAYGKGIWYQENHEQ